MEKEMTLQEIVEVLRSKLTNEEFISLSEALSFYPKEFVNMIFEEAKKIETI